MLQVPRTSCQIFQDDDFLDLNSDEVELASTLSPSSSSAVAAAVASPDCCMAAGSPVDGMSNEDDQGDIKTENMGAVDNDSSCSSSAAAATSGLAERFPNGGQMSDWDQDV